MWCSECNLYVLAEIAFFCQFQALTDLASKAYVVLQTNMACAPVG
jgi:hypothetical protein